jgi:glutamate synthase (NADPH/NADH) small chain
VLTKTTKGSPTTDAGWRIKPVSDKAQVRPALRATIQRQEVCKRPVSERTRDFEEVSLGFSEEQAMTEASRCLQCPTPTCIRACPVGIDIPAFIKHIENNDCKSAVRVLRNKNSIPEVTGRVCPQERLCEAVCVLSKKGKPVAIGALERFAADHSNDLESKVERPTGKKVAVIGSGPAGLTVAADLQKLGHQVTIYEALHETGGVLTYGIPAFRLPKEIVMKSVNYIRGLGVKIEKNTIIGKTLTVDELLESGFDVIFIGSGAGSPKFLGIPGENLIGVYSANEFLTRCNLMKAYKFPEYDTPILVGQRVAVIGGGNVTMDAARAALRLGSKHVHIVYRRTEKEMPARLEEIENTKSEGVQFMTLTNPVRVLGDEAGRARGLECVKMELGKLDSSGRRRPFEIKGSNFTLDSDMVIVAIGQGPNPIIRQGTPQLKVDEVGYVLVDPRGRTSRPRIWAAGDIVPGSDTVIEAMGGGKKVAKDMHLFLTNKEVQAAPWAD